MDFLVEMGRGLALYGVIGLLFVAFTPNKLEQLLVERNAKFGILMAALVAIIVGFLVATIGGR